jgi:hypothetical protein
MENKLAWDSNSPRLFFSANSRLAARARNALFIFAALTFAKPHQQYVSHLKAQSTELTRGPPEFVQHFSFIGGVHIGARYGLAKLFAYPSGEEGGYFLVQIISICLPSRTEEGGWGSAPCAKRLHNETFFKFLVWSKFKQNMDFSSLRRKLELSTSFHPLGSAKCEIYFKHLSGPH